VSDATQKPPMLGRQAVSTVGNIFGESIAREEVDVMSREDEIRARLGAATRKHDWFVHGGTSVFVNWYQNNDVFLAETFVPEWHENKANGREEAHANAQLIAHSPADIDYLLAENKRLRDALSLLKHRIDDPAWSIRKLENFIVETLQPKEAVSHE